MIGALKDRIRSAGLRVTASRVAVLELLNQTDRPLNHLEVTESLAHSTWDRATLYRNLMDLTEAGLLERVSLGSTWHFEAQDPDHASAHPHFVCTECGTVECAPEVTVTPSKKRIGPKSIRRGTVQVQLHGLCDDCV